VAISKFPLGSAQTTDKQYDSRCACFSRFGCGCCFGCNDKEGFLTANDSLADSHQKGLFAEFFLIFAGSFLRGGSVGGSVRARYKHARPAFAGEQLKKCNALPKVASRLR
jgi:hypothetical protein